MTALIGPPMLFSTPRQEVYTRQGGCCGACGDEIDATAPFAWGSAGLLWLTCFRCRVKGATVAAAPRGGVQANLNRLGFPPLLRLRLRVGRPSLLPPVSGQDLAALRRQQWNHFRSPQHVLWVAQGGRCYFHTLHVGHSERLVLDHAHNSGALVRALLCTRCNIAEGKSGRSLAAHLPAYRRTPPAQQMPVLRGLTYEFMQFGRG